LGADLSNGSHDPRHKQLVDLLNQGCDGWKKAWYNSSFECIYVAFVFGQKDRTFYVQRYSDLYRIEV